MSVDIIMPVYNQEKLIKRAIDSIPPSCNVIVCDDGSTDGTLKVLESIPRVKIIRNEENRGIGYSLKRLMDECTSYYICQLDSDDYFLPGVKDVLYQLDGSDLVLYNIQYSDGRKRRILSHNVGKWVGNGKFIRREFLGNIRPHDVRIHEDQYVHHALLKKNPKCKFTDIYAYYYNKREGSLTWEYFKKGEKK